MSKTKSKFRIIQYGTKGKYEPQILNQGWFFDRYVGFIDYSRCRFTPFGPGFSNVRFNTLEEAKEAIKKYIEKIEYLESENSKVRVLPYE